MRLKRKAILLIERSSLVRYLLSGFVVTAYSLTLLTLLARFNFYLAYIVVELSSNLIRCRLFEQFVFIRDEGSPLARLKRYGSASLPVIAANYLTFFFFPASSFVASLRAVIISISLGFLLAKKAYTKDRKA